MGRVLVALPAALRVVAAGVPLSGCIAAAIVPVAASSSAIVKSRMDRKRAERQRDEPPPLLRTEAGREAARRLEGARIVRGATVLPPPSGQAVAVAQAAPVPTLPAGMQYLYGSGEAAAGSIQAYRALSRYIADVVSFGRKDARRQVVLSDGATLDAPQFEPCGPKPLAIVLDVDETAVLNLGYEADEATRTGAYDPARWSRWETSGADKVVAVPGAKMAIDAARALGVTVIFNSNRSADNAAATAAALDHAGLGPVEHRRTLWLKGDDGGGPGKDNRRWAIASGYCVVAMVGDQLGDFSDLFNDTGLSPSTRRALSGSPALAALWGNGWFVLPNPVYGTALKGGVDDVFPRDTRWTDPGEAPPPAPTPVQEKK